MAHPDDLWNFQAIASAPLPGRHQTVVRAEIVAATAAVALAVKSDATFCLWVDNQRVVQLLHRMMEDPDHIWPAKTCNHDVINELAHTMKQASYLCKGVFKVTSHQKHHTALPAAERWCFCGNEAADNAAASAFSLWPALMTSWQVLCQQLDHLRKVRDDLHSLLLNIGVECLFKRPDPHVKHSSFVRRHDVQLVMTEWKFPQTMPAQAQPYQIPELPDVLTWIELLHNNAYPVQRWSWWQLYVDAVLHVKKIGPWYQPGTKQWKGGLQQPPETFLRKSRWMAQFLTKLAKACQLKLPTDHTSAAGSHIAFWTTTLPVQVPPARTEAIDEWLRQFLPCASKTADLRRIG